MNTAMSMQHGARPRQNPLAGTLRVLRLMARNKSGFVGFLIVVFMVFGSFIAPIVVPFDPTGSAAMIYVTPSWAHPFGTDYEGRDVLAQVLRGGSDVVIVGFLTALLTTAIAVTFGALSAFIGGRVDWAITGLADVVLTIPALVLFIVIAGLFSLSSAWQLSIILAAVSWPLLLRAVRAQILSLKERDYVEAARALDLGTRHIIFREMLPNMMSYIVINFVLAATSAIYLSVTLVFLGLVPLSEGNWGVMLNLANIRGAVYLPNALPYVLGPTAAIVLLQFSLVLTLRSLDEVFNPRLRGGG
jgi:peptide/nickel transport system permease protein